MKKYFLIFIFILILNFQNGLALEIKNVYLGDTSTDR
jgi:hypothetical protein